MGDGSQAVPQTAPGSGSTALLMCAVRNLTGSASVRINGNDVGSLTASPGTNWVTQLVAVSGTQRNNGNNEIVAPERHGPLLDQGRHLLDSRRQRPFRVTSSVAGPYQPMLPGSPLNGPTTFDVTQPP